MAIVSSGFSLPSGVNTKDDVIAMQKKLGVTPDGVWGPKTQAAYESSGGKSQFDAIYDQIYNRLNAPAVSYSMPSRESIASDISAILKPQLDQAIAARQEQTLSNRAAIDADAASRGMGRSTFVTDVKDRAMDAEASDISGMQSAYEANLLQAVQEQYNQHLANKFAADQFNASAAASAKAAAYPYAMAEYAKATAKTGGDGKSGDYYALIDELQNTYTNPLTAMQRVGNYSSKYTKDAIDAARGALYEKYYKSSKGH